MWFSCQQVSFTYNLLIYVYIKLNMNTLFEIFLCMHCIFCCCCFIINYYEFKSVVSQYFACFYFF